MSDKASDESYNTLKRTTDGLMARGQSMLDAIFPPQKRQDLLEAFKAFYTNNPKLSVRSLPLIQVQKLTLRKGLPTHQCRPHWPASPPLPRLLPHRLRLLADCRPPDRPRGSTPLHRLLRRRSPRNRPPNSLHHNDGRNIPLPLGSGGLLHPAMVQQHEPGQSRRCDRRQA